jgi:hypothetical protein
MERTDLETWMTKHPESIHTESKPLLDRGEHDALDHAHRDAWVQAKAIAQKRLREYQTSYGYPASEAFVTREICHDLARELKLNEPEPDDPSHGGEEWVSRSLLDPLEPDAKQKFVDWLHELAKREEHSTWSEIVRYTDRRAKTLIREEHFTDQCEWDPDHRYSLVAARVLRMLIADFEAHAAKG